MCEGQRTLYGVRFQGKLRVLGLPGKCLLKHLSQWLLRAGSILVKKKSQRKAHRVDAVVENFRLSGVRANKGPDICKERAQRVEGKNGAGFTDHCNGLLLKLSAVWFKYP